MNYPLNPGKVYRIQGASLVEKIKQLIFWRCCFAVEPSFILQFRNLWYLWVKQVRTWHVQSIRTARLYDSATFRKFSTVEVDFTKALASTSSKTAAINSNATLTNEPLTTCDAPIKSFHGCFHWCTTNNYKSA